MDDELYLIGQSFEKNQYGVQIPTTTRRKVLIRVDDIARAEFSSAGRNGLNPEFKFTVFFGDYAGEAVCEYNSKTYSIYRTYRVPGTDDLELYVERKGGTNGIKEQ